MFYKWNLRMDIIKTAFNETEDFVNTHIFDSEIKEKIDELKIALDDFKEEPIVQGILDVLPVFEYLIPVFRTGVAVKDRFYLKKIVRFVKAIQDGTISEEDINKHRKTFEKGKGGKEIETILLVLERFNDELKAEYLGKFYLAFLKGIIIWDEFCELTEVTDRMIMVDYEVLTRIYKEGPETDINKVNYKYDRLVSLGLFKNLQRAGGIVIKTEKDNKYVALTDLGRMYCDILFDNYQSSKASKSSNRDLTIISEITRDEVVNMFRNDN